jgi:hypothetical protein
LAAPDDPVGRVGRVLLIVGSCVTVGRLLAGAAPLLLLKAGVVAMAGIDAIFIFGDFFDEENTQFDAAVPAADLPRLQVVELGDSSTDYGDFFVAGLVGGILAAERRPQTAAAIAMVLLAQAFNQLHLIFDSLPGTVPPAVVMLAAGWWGDRGGAVARASRRPPAADQAQPAGGSGAIQSAAPRSRGIAERSRVGSTRWRAGRSFSWTSARARISTS